MGWLKDSEQTPTWYCLETTVLLCSQPSQKKKEEDIPINQVTGIPPGSSVSPVFTMSESTNSRQSV